MIRLIFGALVLSLLLFEPSWGFDGNRKGFVFGGGLGFSSVTTSASFRRDSETTVGAGAQLLIGYALNDGNMIIFESIAGGYRDRIDGIGVQIFNGASWYHYFRSSGRSAFTTAGIGRYLIMRGGLSNSIGVEFGLLIGGGYEFARHWQAGAYFSFGRTSSNTFEDLHVNILISAVAF